jgi:hypothetical protein
MREKNGNREHVPVKYGFAAVSSEPSPEPMTKVAPQKPPKDWCRPAGHMHRAPMPYRVRPKMKTVLYP